MRKNLEIQKVLKKNQLMEQEKIDNYNKKQEYIQQRKDELEHFQKEIQRIKGFKIFEQEKKIETTLKKK